MSPTKVPSWGKHEKAMHSPNVKEARAAADKFEKERKWETDHDSKMAEWEKGRKISVAKQKPPWVKKSIKAEREESSKELRKFQEGGRLDYKIHPSMGYLLIKILPKNEEKTKSGFVLTAAEDMPNEVAIVMGVGPDLIVGGSKIPAPCKITDWVLLKKMAGLEITSFGEEYRICLFSDILAVLE
jgi:co-chaperonin GroES (HSP10)